MAKKDNENAAPVVTDGADIVMRHLKDKENLPHIFNFEEDHYYKVSTGSLNLDIELDGGLTSGTHRLIGPPESGKSSFALEICRNFMAASPNRRGFYVNAEGKLNKDMRTRCGLTFVTDPREWVDGTIFVLETNVYEPMINIIADLVNANASTGKDEPRGVQTQYCFVIDSTDALILKSDYVKKFDEDNKVAGTPLMTKRFLQRMANKMAKRGHVCLLLSQYSTNIQLSSYAKAEDKRPQQGGGGWGAAHFAHLVLEFLTSFGKDDILENDKEKPSKTNKRIGKQVNVRFKKTTNEKTGMEVSYPVKFGVVGRSSVWTSREVADIMLSFGEVRRKKSWFEFTPRFLAKLEEAKLLDTLEGKTQLQGESNIHAWLESNPSVVEYLYNEYKSMLTFDTKHVVQEAEESEGG